MDLGHGSIFVLQDYITRSTSDWEGGESVVCHRLRVTSLCVTMVTRQMIMIVGAGVLY